MIETIDTNFDYSGKDIPEGRNTFRVTGFKKNGKLYIIKVSYDGGKEGEQVFFASNIGPLLKVLGCSESTPGVYILDTDVIIGKPFAATVFLQTDKKDPNKVYRNMKDFDEQPF